MELRHGYSMPRKETASIVNNVITRIDVGACRSSPENLKPKSVESFNQDRPETCRVGKLGKLSYNCWYSERNAEGLDLGSLYSRAHWSASKQQ